MPVTPTFPGVYIEEIPSGVRTITGVSTSVGAFVDYFRRGLVNKPIRVFSFGDFEREFGGLDQNSEASYGIQQFFLNGGTDAWVVRSVGKGAEPAKAILPDADGGTALQMEAGRGTRSNPGKWGNQLRAQVDPVGDDRFNLTVLLVEKRGGREVVVTSEAFRNLSMQADDARQRQHGCERREHRIETRARHTSGHHSAAHDWNGLGRSHGFSSDH